MAQENMFFFYCIITDKCWFDPFISCTISFTKPFVVFAECLSYEKIWGWSRVSRFKEHMGYERYDFELKGLHLETMLCMYWWFSVSIGGITNVKESKQVTFLYLVYTKGVKMMLACINILGYPIEEYGCSSARIIQESNHAAQDTRTRTP